MEFLKLTNPKLGHRTLIWLLVPFGDSLEVMEKFCCLSHKSGDKGVAVYSDAARIRNGWSKSRDLLPYL